MLDMKFLRTNPDLVKENIRKKFQDRKLPLVDEVIEAGSQRPPCRAEQDIQEHRRPDGSGQKGRS